MGEERQQAIVADLAGEAAALDRLLAALDEGGWRTATPFRGWTVFDHVGHLCISERTAARAIEEPDAFAADAAAAMRQPPAPVDWSGVAVPRLGAPDGAALREMWRAAADRVCRGLAALPADARVPWYGPAMSVPSFATARLMETWAHGETIRDALGAPDPGTARLRHVCDLGWRTRGFALRIHGQPANDAAPCLVLTAPDGGTWTWGDPDAADRIAGSARDFARVVCQCRNVADTRLSVVGEAAARWMAVAQCFVGGRSEPPAPGFRRTALDVQEIAA